MLNPQEECLLLLFFKAKTEEKKNMFSFYRRNGKRCCKHFRIFEIYEKRPFCGKIMAKIRVIFSLNERVVCFEYQTLTYYSRTSFLMLFYKYNFTSSFLRGQ